MIDPRLDERRRGLRATLLLLAALLVSCTPPEEDPAPAGHRLAVLAPAAAEMLEALGLGDRVVAVGEYGPWPGAMADLPVVGGYATPNAEQILDLGVDTLVSTASEAAGDAHGRLEALGVRVIALDTSTQEGVFASLEQLGEAFGAQDRAGEVAGRLRDELGDIERAAADLPPRRVLFVVGRDPLFVAGPGSHIDRMIVAVGGVNVAADTGVAYARLSMEAALARTPDVIIDTSDNRPDAPLGPIVGSWGQWPFLPAVRDGRVYRVHPSQLVIPGIRLAGMTRLMGRLIHPERFGEPDAADFGPTENDEPAS